MNDNLPEKRKQRFYLFIKLLVLVLLVLLLLRFCKKEEPAVQSNQKQTPIVVAEVVNVQDEWSPNFQDEQQIVEDLQVPQIEKQEEFSVPVQTDQQENLSPTDLVQIDQEQAEFIQQTVESEEEEIKVI